MAQGRRRLPAASAGGDSTGDATVISNVLSIRDGGPSPSVERQQGRRAPRIERRPPRLWPALAGLALVCGGGATAQAQHSALTLESAVHLALTRNERAGAADERAAGAAARLDKARSFFFPTLAMTGTYTRRAYQTTRKVGDSEVTLQRYNALQGTATFGMTLFDARSIPLYRQAARDRDATFLQSADDKRLLGFEAADAFLATLSLDQVLAASERRLEFARKNLEDATGRFEAQLVSSNDVTRARLELATAERERARAQGGAQTAYLQLGFLLDTEIAGSLAMPDSLLEAATVTPAEAATLVTAARARRLDVAASRRRAAALHASAQEPLLRYLPNFAVSGQSRLTNEGGLSGRERDWSLGVNLGWALYDGGVRGADRDERLALAAVADLDTRARSRKIAVEIESAIVVLSSAQAAIAQATVAVDVARQNAAESTELYRQGLVRALEVADAGVRLFEADVALARERFGLALAYLDLRAALGLDPMGKEPAL